MSISGTSAERPPHMALLRKARLVLNFQGILVAVSLLKISFSMSKVILLISICVIVLKINKFKYLVFFICEKRSLLTL